MPSPSPSPKADSPESEASQSPSNAVDSPTGAPSIPCSGKASLYRYQDRTISRRPHRLRSNRKRRHFARELPPNRHVGRSNLRAIRARRTISARLAIRDRRPRADLVVLARDPVGLYVAICAGLPHDVLNAETMAGFRPVCHDRARRSPSRWCSERPFDAPGIRAIFGKRYR